MLGKLAIRIVEGWIKNNRISKRTAAEMCDMLEGFIGA